MKTRPKSILGSSIRAALAASQPILSSAFRRFGKVGLLSIACAASAATAHAQSPFLWDGLGASNNWSDPNNWSGGSAPSSGAQIHFAGSVDLTPNNNLTLTGSSAATSITFDSGSSAFNLVGNGITLTGGITNNSSAGQTVTMPVQLGGAQTWNAASGNLTVNSTVDLNGYALTTSGSHDINFQSPINGSGSVTLSGPGFVNMAAANNYTGNTVVNGGVLAVNGSIASAQTTVGSGGILVGSGTIGGNLTNNGILAPIHIDVDASGFALGAETSISSGANSLNAASFPVARNLVLTVNGSFTQSQNGVLVIFYGGPSSAQHTSLSVNGQANLGGTLYLVQVNGARVSPNEQTTIITANGGVTGKFAVVDNAALINATIGYEPTSVVLETSQGSIFDTIKTVSGISGNLLNLAKGLDSASNDPRAARIFSILDSDTLPQLVKDLYRINPEQLTSNGSIGASTSGVHLQNLQFRMQALQSGATGFNAMGFHIGDNNAVDTNAGVAGPSGPDGKGGKEVVAPPADNRWGSFITGTGEFDHVGDTQNARGFNLDSGGITLGVDYRFTDHFVAGVFFGYTYSGIDIANGGRISVDTGKGGIYGTYFDGGFYVNSAVQGGYDAYESNRSALGGTAHSAPTGGDFSVLFAPGYNWTVGGLTFGPTSRFQYSYESTGGFTESGSLAPLSVSSQHTESIVSAFGMKASYDWKVGTAIIRPELRLEWEHEYGDVATSIAADLASGAGSSFSVTGPVIGRDDLHLGTGVGVVMSDRLTLYVYYDGQFFRTNYDASTVTGGFRYQF